MNVRYYWIFTYYKIFTYAPQTSQSLAVSQSVSHFGRNLKNADKIYSMKKLADSLIGLLNTQSLWQEDMKAFPFHFFK